MTKDELYIKRCLELARQGQYYVAPNPMVGAVLADRQGVIIFPNGSTIINPGDSVVVVTNNPGLTDLDAILVEGAKA